MIGQSRFPGRHSLFPVLTAGEGVCYSNEEDPVESGELGDKHGADGVCRTVGKWVGVDWLGHAWMILMRYGRQDALFIYSSAGSTITLLWSSPMKVFLGESDLLSSGGNATLQVFRRGSAEARVGAILLLLLSLFVGWIRPISTADQVHGPALPRRCSLADRLDPNSDLRMWCPKRRRGLSLRLVEANGC